jgi:hypothetical protein
MQLLDINKSRYRKHLNIVIVALIISLMSLALLFGQGFIALLSSPEGDNFVLNLAGVIMAAVLCIAVVWSVRSHHFMSEVVYVWQLKQVLNRIYRKHRKIEQAAFEQDNKEAMIILNFYYQASMQLYKLDDNTITLESLQERMDKLENHLQADSLVVKIDDYREELLVQFG